MTNRANILRRAMLAGTAVASLVAGTIAATEPASAYGTRYYRGGGYYHGGGYNRHHGLGVGAAIGLGVLGAAAAGVAASQYYNGYPVYPEGGHAGYGYDYYPDHGGYYGPY